MGYKISMMTYVYQSIRICRGLADRITTNYLSYFKKLEKPDLCVVYSLELSKFGTKL